MSRLKKIAEIYDGFKNSEKYYEVFKNPSDKEIEEIKKSSGYASIRGVILSDGTIYSWPGDILHDDINNHINEKIDINQFRFACEPRRGWIIDLNKNFTKQQGLEMIKKYNSILSRFGDIQETFFIFFASDFKQHNSIHLFHYEIDEELAQMASNFSNKLTKKAEAYSGFELDGIFHEVFKNPTNSEIQECKKEYNSIRGVINNEGIFVWPGEIWHKQLQRIVQDPVDINGFRFAYDNGWEFNTTYNYDLEDVLKIIDDNYNLFNNMGDLNKTMYIGPDKNGEYYEIMGYDKLKAVIQDKNIMIFNYTNKKTRLKKIAEYIHCHNCGWDNGDFLYEADGTLQGWAPKKDTKRFKELDKKQIYKTFKDFEEKNPDGICPKCGKQELDID